MNTPPRTPPPSLSIQHPTTHRDDVLLESLRQFHEKDGVVHDDDKLYHRLMDVYNRLKEDWPDDLEMVGFDDISDNVGTGGTSISNSGTLHRITPANNNDSTTPPLFQSEQGQLHLQALMDQCDITQERAISLTFTVLTGLLEGADFDDGDSFSHASGATADDTGDDNTDEDDEDKATTLIQSHLGTPSLFYECLSRFRWSFVERLRILVECLRIDLEGRAGGDADADNDASGANQAGYQAISKFLTEIDSQTIRSGKKRGLFQLLLKFAMSTLPESLWGDVCYSAAKLVGTGGYNTAGTIGGAYSNNNNGTNSNEYIALSLRNEAIEALSILLYDRLEGGVHRSDLYNLLHVASSMTNKTNSIQSNANEGYYGGDGDGGLEYFEFGMSAERYVQNGGLLRALPKNAAVKNSSEFYSRESAMQSIDTMRSSLNSLWALLCAECMGLWRSNADGDWIRNHPLFVGVSFSPSIVGQGGATTVDTPNAALTGRDLGLSLQNDDSDANQAQKELGMLYRKLKSLGESLRDRRRVAYKSRRRAQEDSMEDQDYDDNDSLWGVQAPEGVALLSFGLLLQIACLSVDSNDEFSTKLSKWGRECAHMANEECAAFAYLERVLDGVVFNPLGGVRNGLSRRLGMGKGEGAEIVRVLAGRKDITMLVDDNSMVLMDTDGTPGDEEDDGDFISGLPTDASSVVYSSIGREILSSTIRVFKQQLLSLQSSSAVENIGMLVDLAAIIYRHSTPLCDQFWSDWNEFSSAMLDEGESPSSSDESMCFLLETAHNLATLTLAEMANGGRQEAIVKYLRPMSSFLRLISSLCPNSAVVQNVLDSGFLPDGLVSKTVSLCYALAPMASSLNESSQPVTSDERGTIQHATIALESIATIAFLGGQPARDWLRSSLGSAGQPRMLFAIASNAFPRRNSAVSQECSDLASGALNLLSELLNGASIPYQMDSAECFSPSNTLNGVNGAFSYFTSGGIQSNVTLSALSIMSSLAVGLDRNAYDRNMSSRSISSHIETLRDGVKTGLDVLSSLFSSGEVLSLASQIQVDVAYSAILSTAATLLGLRSVMYLHQDEHVRLAALTVRDDIVDMLASSTAVGQVIAHLSTAPITLSKTSFLREMARHAESNVVQTPSRNVDSKYGAWSRFVTPRRASQKSLQREAEKAADAEKGMELLAGGASSLSVISEMALSLILLWGSHVEEMFQAKSSKALEEKFARYSPHNLLLSKVPPSSSHKGPQISMSSLDVISRYLNIEKETQLSGLSAKVIKMCLQLASFVARSSDDGQMAQAGVPAAFAGGVPNLSKVVTRLLKAHCKDSYFSDMEQISALIVINLETISMGVSQQPELTRSILSGKRGKKDFKLADQIVSSIESTVSIVNAMNQSKTYDSRILRLRSAVAIACLEVLLGLWKCCRLGRLNKTEYHACGGVVGHLIMDENVSNLVVELARSCLYAAVSQEDKNSVQDEIPVYSLHEKSIFIGLLSRSLSFLTIETVARMQTSSEKGISFINDLIDPNPVECFVALLSSNRAHQLAAEAWVESGVAKSLDAFLKAYPSLATCTPCSWDLSIRQIHTLSDESQDDSINAFTRWNALHYLAQAETSYAAEFADFFGAINLSLKRPTKDSLKLMDVLNALSSISESKLSALSLVFPDDDAAIQMKPFDQLSSLLLALLSSSDNLTNSDGNELLKMLDDLHKSSSHIYLLTQNASFGDANEACSIRQKLLTSALILLTNYQNLSKDDVSRKELIRYSEVRLGWLDITLNTLQSLQFSDTEKDKDAPTARSQFLYNFGNETELNKKSTENHFPFELLRISCSLISMLAPATDEIDTGSQSVASLSYAFSGDFITCMKQRDAMSYLQSHLNAASTVASLTYRAVYSASSTPELRTIHTNAISIIEKIVAFIHTLAESSSLVVEILELLTAARCCRSFIDNPLLKICKMWASPDHTEQRLSVVQHRGYVPAASGHLRISHSNEDPVHSIWCKVIDVFSAMLRSARLQSLSYANVNHIIHQQVFPIASAALDFVCSFEETIFSCFSSMHNAPKTELAGKNHPASTISSSSFSFTTNRLKEGACIAHLFEQLCIGEVKNKFTLSYTRILKKMNPVMVDTTKLLSAFLGSVGNARELFAALSSASKLSYDQHASIFDAHPLLADGIPNARHESIRNSHFARSCCIIVTSDDYARSRCPTRSASELKPAEEEKSRDTNLEETFQIQVNNEFIDNMEHIAASCMFSVLSILRNTHPALDAFVTFSSDEIQRLDVAAVLRPGTLVAVTDSSDISGYYVSPNSRRIQYGHCKACDRSTRTVLVEFAGTSGTVERQVPWSCITGMEDASRRQSILAHHPAAKSAADMDTKDSTSIGHIILALRWSRHITKDRDFSALAMRIADQAAVLLATEVAIHDEINKKGTSDEERMINAQILDLFDNTQSNKSTDSNLVEQTLKLGVDAGILKSVRIQLRRRLEAASSEREEEQRMWEKQNSGWDASFWGGSNKREGRRSPFRAFNRMSSMDSQ